MILSVVITIEGKSLVFLTFSPQKADSVDWRGACRMAPPVNEGKKINQLWSTRFSSSNHAVTASITTSAAVVRATGVLNTQAPYMQVWP